MLRAARAVTGCMYCIACGFTHLQRLVRRVGEDTVQLVAEIFYWSLSVYLLSVYLLPTTEHYRPCPSMSLRRRSQLGGCTSRIRDTGHRLHAAVLHHQRLLRLRRCHWIGVTPPPGRARIQVNRCIFRMECRAIGVRY